MQGRRLRNRRLRAQCSGPLVSLTAALALTSFASGPAAGQGAEARLGGGSDIAAGAIVVLPQGARIPPVHLVFADNPEARPIEVEFSAESAAGIEIVPDKTRFTIPAGGKVEDRFAIAVRDSVAAGDYPVSVQLVRADIRPTAGTVTNLPAVGARFTVRVTGSAATLVVKAVDSASKKPVEGTLVLSALLQGSNDLFEVNRGLGSSLTTRVAPGAYEAAFLLGERKHAVKRIDVRDRESTEAVLAVETVSFVVTAAKAVREGGQIVVADLVASLQNRLAPIPGGVRLQVRVNDATREVGTVVLRELDVLPLGLTEAKTTFRPDGGWKPGTYRFAFELVTPEFTVSAAKRQTIDVGGGRSIGGPASIAAAIAAVGAVVAFLAFRRRRLG